MTSNGNGHTSDFLNGIDEIIAFLHISEAIFKELYAQGMPARYYNKRWYANKKNIERWHTSWTAINQRYPSKEEENQPVK